MDLRSSKTIADGALLTRMTVSLVSSKRYQLTTGRAGLKPAIYR